MVHRWFGDRNGNETRACRAVRCLARHTLLVALAVLPACMSERQIPVTIDEACTMPMAFSSPTGACEVRKESVLVDMHLNGRLTLFAREHDGKLAVQWSTALPFVPCRVLVSDSGQVLTIDECNHPGRAHAVTVLGDGGVVLADYAISDVLSERELRRCTPVEGGGWLWFGQFSHRFESDTLVLDSSFRKPIVIDLTTGRLTR